ncbi:hypothetical protein LB456_06225 [Psychroflexus sp. CAK57W]|uniref:THC0290_0291 family protein n=1 Tax=Psychroflexus curvus TaxID=2873595 RepID=UPI001CD0294A|nr:hypothetical protein [Psychroflexus curvus]MBZ9627045.1 hypothetical protein [Psychroflexus curvus]MBZ9787051.1 hypothetical protein [Psychroflexus curvus]
MKFKHYIVIAFLCFTVLGIKTEALAQITHEISVMAGPVSFRGDYGLRYDVESNLKNSGLGVGVNHYLYFGCGNCYSNKPLLGPYFNEHFTVRTTISYHSTNKNHYGVWAEKNSQGGLQLRSMFGNASVLEAGTGLEYYLMRIIEFDRRSRALTPYAGVGFNFVYYSPLADTTLEGGLGLPGTTFPTFLAGPGEEPAFTNNPNVTTSINLHVGLKYNYSRKSDLFVEFRWHRYFSDFVDGLRPIGPQNKYDDWMFWLAVGYIFNLEW